MAQEHKILTRFEFAPGALPTWQNSANMAELLGQFGSGSAAQLAATSAPSLVPRLLPPQSPTAPREPRVHIPKCSTGEVACCGSSLLHYELIFDLQPLTYCSDKAKKAFVVDALSERAVQWATVVIENPAPAAPVVTLSWLRVGGMMLRFGGRSSRV